MTFSNLVNELHNAQLEAFKQAHKDESIEENRNRIAQILSDLDKCASFLSTRYEKQLYELALREMQLSYLSVLTASYRQAFMSLRLSLEHWFSGILFSTNEISFRSWLLDEKDISWSDLNDQNTGVLSEKFAHIFWPDCEHRTSTYQNMAGVLYRECSEYVHGNIKTHSALPAQLIYDKATFIVWAEKINTVFLLFLYSFTTRFSASLQGKPDEESAQIVLQALGHLAEARSLISWRI